MKIIKILLVIFLIYFIRRFVQMYRMMKSLQDAQLKAHEDQVRGQKTSKEFKQDNVIDADFKIVD